jgi:hypothetical protein
VGAMTPDALLPHETICRECRGQKRIAVYGPASSTGPCEVWEEDCEGCDGLGVVIDRRASERSASTIADDFTRLHNSLALTHADLVASQDQVDALIKENLQLRAAVDRLRAVDAPSVTAYLRGDDAEC